jgi:hypothetical protein
MWHALIGSKVAFCVAGIRTPPPRALRTPEGTEASQAKAEQPLTAAAAFPRHAATAACEDKEYSPHKASVKAAPTLPTKKPSGPADSAEADFLSLMGISTAGNNAPVRGADWSERLPVNIKATMEPSPTDLSAVTSSGSTPAHLASSIAGHRLTSPTKAPLSSPTKAQPSNRPTNLVSGVRSPTAARQKETTMAFSPGMHSSVDSASTRGEPTGPATMSSAQPSSSLKEPQDFGHNIPNNAVLKAASTASPAASPRGTSVQASSGRSMAASTRGTPMAPASPDSRQREKAASQVEPESMTREQLPAPGTSHRGVGIDVERATTAAPKLHLSPRPQAGDVALSKNVHHVDTDMMLSPTGHDACAGGMDGTAPDAARLSTGNHSSAPEAGTDEMEGLHGAFATQSPRPEVATEGGVAAPAAVASTGAEIMRYAGDADLEESHVGSPHAIPAAIEEFLGLDPTAECKTGAADGKADVSVDVDRTQEPGEVGTPMGALAATTSGQASTPTGALVASSPLAASAENHVSVHHVMQARLGSGPSNAECRTPTRLGAAAVPTTLHAGQVAAAPLGIPPPVVAEVTKAELLRPEASFVTRLNTGLGASFVSRPTDRKEASVSIPHVPTSPQTHSTHKGLPAVASMSQSRLTELARELEERNGEVMRLQKLLEASTAAHAAAEDAAASAAAAAERAEAKAALQKREHSLAADASTERIQDLERQLAAAGTAVAGNVQELRSRLRDSHQRAALKADQLVSCEARLTTIEGEHAATLEQLWAAEAQVAKLKVCLAALQPCSASALQRVSLAAL